MGIEAKFSDLGWLDTLSGGSTPLHRLDPRAKLLTTILFIMAVLSFGKYEVISLLPFFLYIVTIMAIGEVPSRYVLRQLVLVSPFAILLGIFNPLLDHQTVTIAGSWTISGGWLSFISIMLRFVLTVGSTILLVAVTGIHNICRGLERLGVPSILTMQILFLYRYLFVLIDEGIRLVRARALRSFGSRGLGLRVYGHMLGSLLIRTLDRAQRVHQAMLCRGFDGNFRTLDTLKFGLTDLMFLLGWSGAFLGMRLFNVPLLLGRLMAGGLT